MKLNAMMAFSSFHNIFHYNVSYCNTICFMCLKQSPRSCQYIINIYSIFIALFDKILIYFIFHIYSDLLSLTSIALGLLSNCHHNN